MKGLRGEFKKKKGEKRFPDSVMCNFAGAPLCSSAGAECLLSMHTGCVVHKACYCIDFPDIE